jgi:hypothetical protein
VPRRTTTEEHSTVPAEARGAVTKPLGHDTSADAAVAHGVPRRRIAIGLAAALGMFAF